MFGGTDDCQVVRKTVEEKYHEDVRREESTPSVGERKKILMKIKDQQDGRHMNVRQAD